MSSPSPPSKHNMKPQNLIPPSLLIFGPLGGYDCGAALTAASQRQKGNGLPNDIFVAHPSPSPPLPPHHGDIYLRFSHYFSKKGGHTPRARKPKNEGLSNLSKYRLIFLAREFRAQWETWQERRKTSAREEKQKKLTTCSSNFENTGYIFPASVRP